MKTYQVKIDKPSVIRDWDMWEERMVSVIVPYTTAILTARDLQHLYQKIDTHYHGYEVLHIKETSLI